MGRLQDALAGLRLLPSEGSFEGLSRRVLGSPKVAQPHAAALPSLLAAPRQPHPTSPTACCPPAHPNLLYTTPLPAPPPPAPGGPVRGDPDHREPVPVVRAGRKQCCFDADADADAAPPLRQLLALLHRWWWPRQACTRRASHHNPRVVVDSRGTPGTNCSRPHSPHNSLPSPHPSQQVRLLLLLAVRRRQPNLHVPVL